MLFLSIWVFVDFSEVVLVFTRLISLDSKILVTVHVQAHRFLNILIHFLLLLFDILLRIDFGLVIGLLIIEIQTIFGRRSFWVEFFLRHQCLVKLRRFLHKDLFKQIEPFLSHLMIRSSLRRVIVLLHLKCSCFFNKLYVTNLLGSITRFLTASNQILDAFHQFLLQRTQSLNVLTFLDHPLNNIIAKSVLN